ncbi:glycosyltransferase family 2 protein, partial [Bacillus sp. S34]|nr:glycosyltransferase family 2 protein [Bacillus sp. S34]
MERTTLDGTWTVTLPAVGTDVSKPTPSSALRRAALDDVGLLDESLFMYYEDTELAWRLRRRGWRVEYAGDAVVQHDHSASSGVQSDLFVFRHAR